VYEDADVLAFLDIKPNNPGHTLVVPKEHDGNFRNADPARLQKLVTVAQRIGKAVCEATGAPAMNLVTNDGAEAGQVIHHLHFHVIPRHAGDGFRHWPGTPYAEGEAATVLAKITQALG
jgi:histidine triad (HIT) family protein